MREPSFYTPQPATVDVRETHVSVVFLAGNCAYKVKKPVHMPFLDYSSLERRRRFCFEEVRLNRRFARDVYLGVRAVAEHNGELVLADSDDAAAVEYAVVMRRFDEEDTLERLVERHVAKQKLAARVGDRVAELHLAARSLPAGFWTPAYIAERLDENFDTTRSAVGPLVDRVTYEAVRRFSHAFLWTHEELFERRIAEGMVRDVHGDLRAEHVVVESGGLSIVDCLDFDERLRCIDVATDLAFLAMDLERLGARPLAEAAVHAYSVRTGDSDLSLLLPFYASYVAWLRGKVTALRIRQLVESDPAKPVLEERARELFRLSLHLAWRTRLPLVIVLCGVAASGKSTLAADLSSRSGLPHLNSDHIRKELAGISTATRGSPDLYRPEATARTYRELAARATAAVKSGGGVVVDATFHRREHRELMMDVGARTLWIECTAPEGALRSRGAIRERTPEYGSDATWTVTASQLSAWEPLDDVPADDRHALRTDRPVEVCLDELESFVAVAVDLRPTTER